MKLSVTGYLTNKKDVAVALRRTRYTSKYCKIKLHAEGGARAGLRVKEFRRKGWRDGRRDLEESYGTWFEALLFIPSIGLGTERQAWHLDESVSYVVVSNIAEVERDTGFSSTRFWGGFEEVNHRRILDASRNPATVKVCPFITRQMKLQWIIRTSGTMKYTDTSCIWITFTRQGLEPL